MSVPRKHHFLPQFYLRGFSEDRRALNQIEKKTARHYPTQIKDAAAIRDFHELDFAGVEDPNGLEKRLASVEGDLATYLEAFLLNGPADARALHHVLQLLALLRFRVPAVKSHIARSYPLMIRKVAEAMERSGQLPPVPPGLDEQLKVRNLQITITNWKCLELMFDMAADREILDDLERMRATVFRAPFGSAFLTGDQPVALFHPAARGTAYGVGPATPGVELSLPLTSRILLQLDHGRDGHRTRQATSEEVQEFNRRTIIMANEYIFTGETPEPYLRLVRQNRQRFAGMTFDDLNHGGSLLQVHRFLPIGPV